MNEHLTKKYRYAMSELKKANETIVERERTINFEKSKRVEVEKERDYYKNKFETLQKGALVYSIRQDGYVEKMVEIPPNFYTTYPQPYPNTIGTKFYQNNPHVKVVDGKVIVDEKIMNKMFTIL